MITCSPKARDHQSRFDVIGEGQLGQSGRSTEAGNQDEGVARLVNKEGGEKTPG